MAPATLPHAPAPGLGETLSVAKPPRPAPDAASRAAPAPEALIRVPGYEILGELGRGGMGVVYLAKNVVLDRREVLKVVNQKLLGEAGVAERFLREMRSAAKLNHENVVKAYSAPQAGESLVFAMEYVDGEDLEKVVQRQGPLPIPHACHYVSHAAMGLQHAHEQGMVHRDIKPQNLILTRQGKKHVVKVLDFGLAKAKREGEAVTNLTGQGAMMGTPDYMPPEQAQDAAGADIRADIYSLGCTLYFLLTGAPPFTGKSAFAILQAHVSEEATPLSQVRPEAPEELAAVVVKMMAKDPARRYQKPIEVAKALAPFIKPGSAPKPEPNKQLPAVSSADGQAGGRRRAAGIRRRCSITIGPSWIGRSEETRRVSGIGRSCCSELRMKAWPRPRQRSRLRVPPVLPRRRDRLSGRFRRQSLCSCSCWPVRWRTYDSGVTTRPGASL